MAWQTCPMCGQLCGQVNRVRNVVYDTAGNVIRLEFDPPDPDAGPPEMRFMPPPPPATAPGGSPSGYVG